MLVFALGLMALCCDGPGEGWLCELHVPCLHKPGKDLRLTLLMCLGAVKPHGYSFGFGFHVGSKIYRVLKQKVLYVQKL